MDQSFSPKNLRRIWDLEARRGRDRLTFYPNVRAAYEEARDARQQERNLRNKCPDDYEEVASAYREIAQNARNRASFALEEALAETSSTLVKRVEEGMFTWGLTRSQRVKGSRQTYLIANSPDVFFADKQLQLVISSLLPSAPKGRQAILAGLVQTLDNSVPKHLVRMDISNFYDNVGHRPLMKLVNESKTTPTCRRLVGQLLQEMEAISGQAKGLPTGVGLSAKLAELFVSQIDRTLRESPDTLYFARYVDDIILVRGEKFFNEKSANSLVGDVDSNLQAIELFSNPQKTQSRQLELGVLKEFEFLGYRISRIPNRGVSVKLTKSREASIRDRIDRAFQAWDRSDPDNHGRRSLIIDRIRFLTGNTRLSHNKRNALVGIYFSNPSVTDAESLSGLDKYLTYRASQSSLPAEVAEVLANLTFVDGFERKRLHRWRPQRLKQLKGAWND